MSQKMSQEKNNAPFLTRNVIVAGETRFGRKPCEMKWSSQQPKE